jgi:uncharacterized protein (DUF1330 family)
MPNGYVIFTEVIQDQVGYDGYVQKALPTVIQMGGRAIVADDNPEAIEGQWHGSRVVILEFDSWKLLATGTSHPSSRRSSVSGTLQRKRTR